MYFFPNILFFLFQEFLFSSFFGDLLCTFLELVRSMAIEFVSVEVPDKLTENVKYVYMVVGKKLHI